MGYGRQSACQAWPDPYTGVQALVGPTASQSVLGEPRQPVAHQSLPRESTMTGPPAPQLRSQTNFLTWLGFACPIADSCIAVGDQILGREADYQRPRATFVAEHTNQGWTVQTSRNVGGPIHQFRLAPVAIGIAQIS